MARMAVPNLTPPDTIEMGGDDNKGNPVTLAADEEVLGEETLVNEQELADTIAREH